jgi:hypothetical protein
MAAKMVLTSPLTHLIRTMSLLFSPAGIGHDIYFQLDPIHNNNQQRAQFGDALLFVDSCFNTVGQREFCTSDI